MTKFSKLSDLERGGVSSPAVLITSCIDDLCFVAEKSWKRMVTKVTYVGEGFTRKPPKYERFIRPMGLRFKKAHVTHPEVSGCIACMWLTSFVSPSFIFPILPLSIPPSSHPLSLPPFLPQLKATFHLPIIGVKKNPQSPTFTNLGVITKGTIIEVISHPSISLTHRFVSSGANTIYLFRSTSVS